MNPPTFYIIPADGKSVRDPQSGIALPPEGAAKPKTGYWLRRLRDGDVIVKQAPALRVVPSTPSKKGDAK